MARERSRRYGAFARHLIRTEPVLEYIKNSQVRIAFLASDQEMIKNGRYVFGQCEKVPSKYSWIVPYDFTITVFEPNVERFTTEQIRILMLHELLHIGIDIDGNEEQYRIVPHDIEEFNTIINRYGMDWSEEG